MSIVDLLSTSSYGALAGSTITNTGPTTINGDLGLSPGSAVTGAPVVTGVSNIANPAAAQAQLDLTTAYNQAAGLASTVLDSAELGGRTLAPGTYSSPSGAFAITSVDLTLDAGGDANAVWVFQMASTLTVGSGRAVILSGGAQAGNVFWQVGSSATLGTTSQVKGTLLALASIALQTGAVLNGRALARNAAVTLDSNTITVPSAPAPPITGSLNFGSAINYSVLASSGITVSSPTTVQGGNVGSFPTIRLTTGGLLTLTPPSIEDNFRAAKAQTDAASVYATLAASSFASLGASSVNLSVNGNGANNHTYVPGNYSAGSSMSIPSDITLDAGGNSAAIFVFKAGSTLTLGASVLLINGAQAANVVFLVGSSFTKTAPGTMVGTVLATASATLAGGTLNGRVVALNGSITINGAENIASSGAVLPTASFVLGSISGTAIPGALISVTSLRVNASSPLSFSAVSDVNGNFLVEDLLPAGTYSITASKLGFVFKQVVVTIDGVHPVVDVNIFSRALNASNS